MNVLIGRPPNTPEQIRLHQQLEANTKMYETYYGKSAANLNPTGERATRHEIDILLAR
jgi:hypothetical protein